MQFELDLSLNWHINEQGGTPHIDLENKLELARFLTLLRMQDTPPQKLNISNISAVTDPILMKL